MSIPRPLATACNLTIESGPTQHSLKLYQYTSWLSSSMSMFGFSHSGKFGVDVSRRSAPSKGARFGSRAELRMSKFFPLVRLRTSRYYQFSAGLHSFFDITSKMLSKCREHTTEIKWKHNSAICLVVGTHQCQVSVMSHKCSELHTSSYSSQVVIFCCRCSLSLDMFLEFCIRRTASWNQ